MENPFELIDHRLDRLEWMLEVIIDNQKKTTPSVIDDLELTISVEEALQILGLAEKPCIRGYPRSRISRSIVGSASTNQSSSSI